VLIDEPTFIGRLKHQPGTDAWLNLIWPPAAKESLSLKRNSDSLSKSKNTNGQKTKKRDELVVKELLTTSTV
jgi:hypothetical protein